MYKTKEIKQLEKAKDEALKHPPIELRKIMINTARCKEKKNSVDILLEMRYGSRA